MAISTPLLDFRPTSESFFQEVIDGLNQSPKILPTKYLYDERGSRLFEKICQLDEYYLTRTELEIMEGSGAEMAKRLGPGIMLVEFGSGSSVKTRILLDHLEALSAYVPVDISHSHLQATAKSLAAAYPEIQVRPVCADFTERFELPDVEQQPSRNAVYVPGSTIGNFCLDFAVELLHEIAYTSGPGGCLLIGIDLQKDVETLELAYNDAQGVTAEFNLNILRHINRELDADFDLDQFEHLALYNDEHDRIELFLVSKCNQLVTIGDEQIEFDDGESICTEYSHKYTVEGFAALAEEAGFDLAGMWSDPQQAFAVLLFEITD